MPHLQITILEGCTLEQKRKVVERMTRALNEEVGVPLEGISIAFVEVPKDSFARYGVLIVDRQSAPK
jgi:4-oxalocrotonate tautomerase